MAVERGDSHQASAWPADGPRSRPFRPCRAIRFPHQDDDREAPPCLNQRHSPSTAPSRRNRVSTDSKRNGAHDGKRSAFALSTAPLCEAIEHIEALFWWYCDDYVEWAKGRARGGDACACSAHHALAASLSVLQRVFAPFLPFAAEEC
ncbi:class I tRNA ligase family protein [Burkholderia ubonensis]|uniref:class I tRNA ligase family protein n=1 Tax=Burkholderia ubonensis TaxID=101571 RepID=UPI002FCBECEE